MERIFIEIVNNALSVSFLILAVMVVRLVVKMPRWITCLLWMVVAVKLLLPVSFESPISLNPINRPLTVQHVILDNRQLNSSVVDTWENVTQPAGDQDENVTGNNTGNTTQSAEKYGTQVGESNAANGIQSSEENVVNATQPVTANTEKVMRLVGMYLWIIGMIAMSGYAIITFFLLKRKVRFAVRVRKNVYICDDIADPFILGIMKPRIYLPSELSKEEEGCILKHEKMHLARKDYIWKPVGFLLLIVYWFQPLCWVAYILLCRDIEYACDEKAIAGEDDVFRANYCETLLGYSGARRIINACPIAFGETSVKERIKNVLHYKNPTFWAIVLSVVVCLVVTLCFATNQRQATIEERYTYLDILQCTGIMGYCVTEPGGTTKSFVIETTDPHFEELLDIIQTTQFKDRIRNVLPWQTHTHQGQVGDYSFDMYFNFGETQLAKDQTISGALLNINNYFEDLSIESLGESSLCSVTNQEQWARNIMDILENYIVEDTDASVENEDFLWLKDNAQSENGLVPPVGKDLGNGFIGLKDDEVLEYTKWYLANLPEDPEELAKKNCFVSTRSKVYGSANLETFMNNYNNNKPATLTIVQYTTEGDMVPYSILYDMYDREKVTVVMDNRRDIFASKEDSVLIKTFKYISMLEYTSEEGHFREVVLHDEPEMTAQKLEKTLASSTMEGQSVLLVCHYRVSDDGADAAKNITVESYTQQEIFDKMVNAVENYSYAKGKMVYAIPNVWNVEFETDLETGTAFEKTVGEGLLSTVTAKDGVITTVTNGVTHTSYGAHTKSDSINRAHMGKRLDGENEYFMRVDPTNTETARNCLLPQEITFNFLGDRDTWEVKEITTYLDRTVWYIEGRLGVVSNDKLGAEEFVMYVDCATGILLKYEVLDKQGNVKHYAYMEELEIR